MSIREIVMKHLPNTGGTYRNLTSIDDAIITELEESDLSTTTTLLKYIFDEVSDPELVSELGREHIISALRQIIQYIKEDDIVRELVGYKTLKRVTRLRGGCPRPWC
jgi:hypothetical protein